MQINETSAITLCPEVFCFYCFTTIYKSLIHTAAVVTRCLGASVAMTTCAWVQVSHLQFNFKLPLLILHTHTLFQTHICSDYLMGKR